MDYRLCKKILEKKLKKVLTYSYEYAIIYLTKEIRLDRMASTLKKEKTMKELSIKEMLKEMEEYGVTEEILKEKYNYDKNDSDFTEDFKDVSFEEYVKCYYMSDRYIKD